jgi:2-polyprenyl-3-methyl-5-hydroxy-6-metoxy-1,4-benzoquinol methylase
MKTKMDHYKETFETWNKVALLYQEKFMKLDIYNETYDFFLNQLTHQKSKLLEIGCGPGNISHYLLTQRSEMQLTGIDIAPNMVELAKKNNPSASFHVMDCREIDQLTRLFDGIVVGFCLPYINVTEVQKLLSDCSELLNPNGVLYLSFVEGENTKSGFQTGSSGDRVYFYFYELTEINRLLTNSGFEEPVVFHVPYTLSTNKEDVHTILISRKK